MRKDGVDALIYARPAATLAVKNVALTSTGAMLVNDTVESNLLWYATKLTGPNKAEKVLWSGNLKHAHTKVRNGPDGETEDIKLPEYPTIEDIKRSGAIRGESLSADQIATNAGILLEARSSRNNWLDDFSGRSWLGLTSPSPGSAKSAKKLRRGFHGRVFSICPDLPHTRICKIKLLQTCHPILWVVLTSPTRRSAKRAICVFPRLALGLAQPFPPSILRLSRAAPWLLQGCSRAAPGLRWRASEDQA